MLKPSPAALSRLREQLSRMKAYRDRLQILKEGRTSEFWKALKPPVELSRDGAQGQVQQALGDEVNSAEVSHLSAVRAETRRKTFDFIVAQVEQADTFMESTDEELATIRAAIAEKEEALKEVAAQEA